MIVYLFILMSALGLARLVLRYDRFRREPLLHYALVLAAGAIVTSPIGWLEDELILSCGRFGYWLGTQAAIAGIYEEAAKINIVILALLAFRYRGDDPLDGVVYGALSGLGFALGESLFHIEMTEGTFEIIGREFVRLVLHGIFGGVDGFAAGLLVTQQRSLVRGIRFLVTAMALHFLWDRACGLPLATGGDAMFLRSMAIIIVLSGMLQFGVCVVIATHWAEETLDATRPEPLMLAEVPVDPEYGQHLVGRKLEMVR